MLMSARYIILLASIPGEAVEDPNFSDAEISAAASRQVTSGDKITRTFKIYLTRI